MRSAFLYPQSLLLLVGLAVGAPACSAREPAERVEPGLHPLAHRFPGTAALLARASDSPATRTATGAGERLRVVGTGRRAMAAELRAIAGGTIELGVEGSTRRIGLRRLAARSDAPRLEAGMVAWGDGAAGEGAVMFARGPAVEDLIVAAAGGDVGYELDLPSGWSLHALPFDPTLTGETSVVEVRDEQGVAWARMSADKAWDARGGEHHVIARLDRVDATRARIHLRVDGDAAGPLAIDPTWISAGYPIAIRVGGTSTPLGNGKVLLAGGATATAELFDPLTGTFTADAVASTARTDATATLLPNGKVAMLGGARGSTYLSTAELYDPITHKFTAAGGLTVPRATHASTLLADGSVFVVGGWTGESLSSTELWDPSTGASKKAAELSFPRSRPLAVRLLTNQVVVIPDVGSTEIYEPAKNAFSLGTAVNATAAGGQSATLLPSGKVLVTGGCASKFGTYACSTAAYIFDPTGGGSDVFSVGPLAEGRGFHSSTLLADGRVLIAGGGIGSGFAGGSPTTLSTELFDPVTSTFSSAGALSTPRLDANAVALPSGDVLITGGETGSDVLTAAAPGAFAATTPLAAARKALVAAPLLDGTVLLVGGGTTDTARFYPLKGMSPTGSLGAARTRPTLTLLGSGEVLVAGDAAGAAAELYDPKAATFSAAGKLVADREGHTATLLADGKVLLTGGRVASTPVSTAELYDPATKKFTATGSMASARADHAATLLSSGKVFIVGGSSAATGELFDPTKGTFTTIAAPLTARARATCVVLPSGKVLVAGGSTRATELYDPSTGVVSFGASLVALRPSVSATLLPSGKVMLFGGDLAVAPSPTELFDSATGRVTPIATATSARIDGATALLPSGQVLVAGGYYRRTFPLTADVPQSTAELWSSGFTAGRPRIDSAPAIARVGDSVTLVGAGFAPAWSAGGGTARSSSAVAPSAIWIPLSGSGAAVGTLSAWTDTQVTWTVPLTSFSGPGRLFVSMGGAISNGVVVTLQPARAGARCTQGPECESGFCADGVCCDGACDGVCRACSAARKGSGADGVCGDVPPELDPARCALFRGSPCKSDAQCGTGHCTDGVCCDSACSGQCEACDVDGSFGVCVPVSGAPHGARAACEPGSEDPCAAKVCDGTARASCGGFVGNKVACRPASCTAGVASRAASCDGSGKCPAAVTQTCAPYLCAGDDCGKPPCKSDAECATDYRCAIAKGATQGECVVRTDNLCDGAHTVTARDGLTSDCSPYVCDVSGCKKSCATSNDCVGGFICDATAGTGTCVAPTAGATESDGGCSAGRTRSTTIGWLAVAAAAGLIRRRRSGSQR